MHMLVCTSSEKIISPTTKDPSENVIKHHTKIAMSASDKASKSYMYLQGMSMLVWDHLIALSTLTR